MRVAWVTHHSMKGVGGAEVSDREMLSQAPDHVEVEILPVDADVDGFDRVVVSRTEKTAGHAARLAEYRPVVWPHGQIWSRDENRPLVEAADPLVLHNPVHLAFEEEWAGRLANALVNPAWMDTTPIYPGEKKDRALWAHRNVAHKGLREAKRWATERSIPLDVVMDSPREKVYETMRSARWFILLSTNLFDAGPRALIEAALSGCELVVKDAGFWDEPADRLRERVDKAAGVFWEAVCG